jgi:hypothetical protein
MQLFGKLQRCTYCTMLLSFISSHLSFCLAHQSNCISHHIYIPIYLCLSISIFLRIRDFWDVTRYCWVSGSPHFEGLYSLHFQGSSSPGRIFLGLLDPCDLENLKFGISYPYLFFFSSFAAAAFFCVCVCGTCASSAYFVPLFLQYVRVNGPDYYK